MADEPEIQAPGTRRSFSWVIQRIQGGDLHAQLTEQLNEIGNALRQYVEDYKGAPKAKLELKLDFKLDKGVVEIIGTSKLTLPKTPAAGAIMWIDREGNFTEQHPNQMTLFPAGPRALDI